MDIPAELPRGPLLDSQIETRNLGRKAADDGVWLIRDVSLVVNPGDRLAIQGSTGAGKTVLLRALAVLDPLQTGSVHWRGRSVASELVPEYRSRVVYLHQRPAL